jgi:hypothetical protein
MTATVDPSGNTTTAGYRFDLSIFAQESRSAMVRLKTGLSAVQSTVSTQK